MKRSICVFVAILLAICCIACQPKQEAPKNGVTVYYKTAQVSYGTQDGVIAPYKMDAAECNEDIEKLLNTYLGTVPPEGFAPTFPQNTRLVSINLDALTAKIVLCDEFAQLTGLNLSIACACLTQTVISFTNCQEVIISADNAQLDGRNYITLNQDSYLLLDESGVH